MPKLDPKKSKTAAAAAAHSPTKKAPPVAAKAPPPKALPKPSTNSTAVTKPKATAVSAPVNIEALAGVGMENVTSSDLLIPRISILQALSPQLQKSKPEYIKDAQQGDFCDTGTGDIFRESMTVVPCFFARVFLEWAPRSSGKGLVKNHGIDPSILDQCTPDDKGRMILPNGNYIAETATYYVLNLDAGGRRSFIPMASTQLRASRKWMTLITAEKLTRSDGSVFTPPLFYRSWTATPVAQSNNEGEWFGWKFEAAEALPEMENGAELLKEARDFYEQVRSGQVTGDVSSMVGEDAAVNATSDAM